MYFLNIATNICFKEAFKIKLKDAIKKISLTALAVPLLSFSSLTTTPVVKAEEENWHEISAEIDYYCKSVTSFSMPIKITATVPKSLEPGETSYSKNSYTEFTIPEDVTAHIRDLLDGVYVFGSVTKFEVISTNKNATVNVAETPIPFPQTDVPESGGVSLRVPEVGGVDAGPFVAGNSGQMVFSAGQIVTDLLVHKENGNDVPLPATCEPVGDPTIAVIPINGTGDPDDPGEPSDPPGGDPSDQPGKDPSDQPGKDPSDQPGKDPSDQPGKDPSDQPGKDPSDQPGKDPSDRPGKDPSDRPAGGLDDGSGDRVGSNVDKKSGIGGVLPKTATNNPLFIMLGALIAIAGGALVFFRKKKAIIE